MKTILFALLFLFVPKICISQLSKNDDAVYLDSLFNMGNEKNYKYIRVTKDYHNPNQKSYEIIDYYKSGKKAMVGTSTTRDKVTKNGIFVYYYENGNKKAVTNFIKNSPVSNEYTWYENGTKKQEGEYIIVDEKKNESKYKVNFFWDANGVQKVTDGNGDYEENNEYLFASGKVKDGFKDGHWEGYHKKMGYTFSENYENQKLVSGVSIDKEKITHNYTDAEVRPMPKKGMDDFYRFIGKNYRAPEVQGLKGKVYMTFVIEKDGKIVEPKILRDIGYGTGTEAIRVVMAYDGFSPGEQRGIKVRCTFSLPLSIQSLESIKTNNTPSPSEMMKSTNPNW